MTHGTNGTEIPGTHTDDDADGAPDLSEDNFAHDGEPTRPEVPAAPREKPAADTGPDDAGLESARKLRGDVLPPGPN